MTEPSASDTADEYHPFESLAYVPSSDVWNVLAPILTDMDALALAPKIEFGSDRRLTEEPNWAMFSSTDLHAMAVAENDPAHAHDLGRTWTDLGNRLGELSSRLLAAAGLMGTTWEGRDATAAARAVVSTASFAADSGRAAQYMGTQVAGEAYAAEAARRLMPPPQEFDSVAELGRTLRSDPVPVDVGAAAEAARANKEDQIRVLSGYHRTSVDVDGSTPVFSTPVPVTAAAAGSTGGGSGAIGESVSGSVPGSGGGSGAATALQSGSTGGPGGVVGTPGPGRPAEIPGSGGPGSGGPIGVPAPGPGPALVPASGGPGRALPDPGKPSLTPAAGALPPHDRGLAAPSRTGPPSVPAVSGPAIWSPVFGAQPVGAGPGPPGFPNGGTTTPAPRLGGGDLSGTSGVRGGPGPNTGSGLRPTPAMPGIEGGAGTPPGQRSSTGNPHMAPYGLGAGLGQGGTREHRRPAYLIENEDVWAVNLPCCPPVIEPEQP